MPKTRDRLGAQKNSSNVTIPASGLNLSQHYSDYIDTCSGSLDDSSQPAQQPACPQVRPTTVPDSPTSIAAAMAASQGFRVSSGSSSSPSRASRSGHLSLYDLAAIACHSGSLLGGHCTALTKHPGSGVWTAFNDELLFSNKTPSSVSSSAYILLYTAQTREGSYEAST